MFTKNDFEPSRFYIIFMLLLVIQSLVGWIENCAYYYKIISDYEKIIFIYIMYVKSVCFGTGAYMVNAHCAYGATRNGLRLLDISRWLKDTSGS